jgi:hypothetical protein
MVTSAKSVARRATVVAAAALAASPLGASAASASGASNIFLYRSRDTSYQANCTGGNHEVRNLGNRALGRYDIFAVNSISTSTVGVFLYSKFEEDAATVAIKQLWCYNTDFYWQYYAANAYHRELTQDYICSGGCQWIGNYYTAWEPGL